MKDYRLVDALQSGERTMLAYVVKLTQRPWTIDSEDVESLKGEGFTDRAILDMNLVTGYFAFVNRLADGLGVPLEEFWENDAAARQDRQHSL